MSDFEPLEALRGSGLRVTPQRRAILGAFSGRPSEHLSAEIVHTRASEVLPELGRGTVYATLSELTEQGLLSSVGSSDPIRYELNTSPHHHFRCLVCRRIHDVSLDAPSVEPLIESGYEVARAGVVAEGTCADCVRYEQGLLEGVELIRESTGFNHPRLKEGDVACAVDDGPLGTIALVATEAGLARVSFPEHGDFSAWNDRAGKQTGSPAARAHLEKARSSISDYLNGTTRVVDSAIDWDSLGNINATALRATKEIPYGQSRPYTEMLDTTSESSRDLGVTIGSNPLPLVFPCHRVMKGREVPRDYVGGPERRRLLIDLELARRDR